MNQEEEEEDKHSKQLDIIVYDVARYPVYEMVEEFAIVPPEGESLYFQLKKDCMQAALSQK